MLIFKLLFSFLLLLPLGKVEAVFSLFKNCGGSSHSDRCQCIGTWILNRKSWQEFDSTKGQLRDLKRPITLDVWPHEEAEASSSCGKVRAVLKVYNSVGFSVTATEGDSFCEEKVKSEEVVYSMAMALRSGFAATETKLVKLLAEDLTDWQCNLKAGTLTLKSNKAQATFLSSDSKSDENLQGEVALEESDDRLVIKS